MIRPAVDALKARRFETLAVTLLLSLAAMLPGALAISGANAHAHASGWLEAYQPVIYLEPEGVAQAQVQALRAEVEAMPMVRTARLRAPDQALEELRAKLGPERVQQLGLSEAMMPTSLVLEPMVPLHGHIQLAARVSGLEAREMVHAVDVPSASALRLMEAARATVMLSGLIVLLLTLVATVLLATFLRRLRDDERDEIALLEMFGASRSDLVRPTMLRGAALGLCAGLLASGSLLMGQLMVGRWAALISGVAASTLWIWALVLSPLILLPVLGLFVGRLSARRAMRPPTDSSLPEVRCALGFGGGRLAQSGGAA